MTGVQTCALPIYFAAHYTENPPKDSPLRFLSIELYANLADDKQINCSGEQGEKKEECEQSVEKFLADGKMQAKLRRALTPYAHSNPFQVNQILLNNFGGGRIPELDVKRLLDLAGEVLGADNYAVNLGYGLYHEEAKSYKDAIAYYDKAAGEIETADFPDTLAKNAELADVFERISLVYQAQYDNARALEYVNRAIGLNAKKYSYWADRCQTYFNMQQWQNVVDDCTTSISLRDTGHARYLRGLSYRVLKDRARAVSDFEGVFHFPALSQDKLKAFPEVRGIYIQDKRYDALVTLLSTNPFLFDEGYFTPPLMSVNYADRCDAYMHLGQNDKAMADCDKALELYPASSEALDDKKKIMENTGTPAKLP